MAKPKRKRKLVKPGSNRWAIKQLRKRFPKTWGQFSEDNLLRRFYQAQAVRRRLPELYDIKGFYDQPDLMDIIRRDTDA